MQLSGKNVLITGGAGFIGSHLVDRVIQENPANVVVVDNFFLGNEENLENARNSYNELKVYRLDASDFASMRTVVEDHHVDVVFNLAVIPLPTSLKYPAWTIRTISEIALSFCELARTGDIHTLVHCSSSEAYGTAIYVPMDEKHPMNAITPYAAGKAAQDSSVQSYIRTFDIDAVIVRPFNNFGPRQNVGSYAGIIPVIVRKVLSGEPVEIYGDGEQTRDFMFVRDTADAFVRIYEQDITRGYEINIATGHEVSVNELVRRLLNVMRVPNYPVIHTDSRPGDVRRHCGDISLAEKLIGYKPSLLTDEQLDETVAWYMRRSI
jgi:UDP-glucose 4-epimerase